MERCEDQYYCSVKPADTKNKREEGPGDYTAEQRGNESGGNAGNGRRWHIQDRNLGAGRYSGIGTMTYITENGRFGTLGHGITDMDTGTLLNLKGGEVYQGEILGITKGKKRRAGRITGIYEDVIRPHSGYCV